MTSGRGPLVALATSVDWPALAPDDRLIAPALRRLGIDAEIAVWTDPTVDWARYDLIVIRSCWDYHDDLGRWLAWIARLDRLDDGDRAGGRLANPAAVLRWNGHKSYLAALEARGLPLVPTRWLSGDTLASEQTVAAALAAAPFDELVCKPAVSAGALGTLRLARSTLADSATQAALRAALPTWRSRGPVLVQPFLPEITAAGEWSLLFFDGAFSHAVVKRPASGDFRVQERHGGTTVAREVPEPLLAAALRVLDEARALAPGEAAAPPHDAGLLYARVDLVVVEGKPLLMELELTEPALFLANDPGGQAADRLARAIAARLSGPGARAPLTRDRT